SRSSAPRRIRSSCHRILSSSGWNESVPARPQPRPAKRSAPASSSTSAKTKRPSPRGEGPGELNGSEAEARLHEHGALEDVAEYVLLDRLVEQVRALDQRDQLAVPPLHPERRVEHRVGV